MQFIKTVKLTQIILNPVGRPRKINEVCPYPNCGQPCFLYTISVKKSEKIYSYIRSRHYDKTLKDHYIDTRVRVKKRRYGYEYNRKLKKAIAFSFKPNLKRYEDLDYSIDSDINTVLPLAVYDFGFKIIPEQINNELKKLNRLKLKVTEKELDWLLRQKQVKGQANVREFYKNLLNILKTGHVVTFGEKAVKEGDRISSLESFTGNKIINISDKYGMLDKILKMREKKKKLSSPYRTPYNNPRRTLQLVTQKECIDK